MKKVYVMTESEYEERINYIHVHGTPFGVKVRHLIWKICKKLNAEKLFKKIYTTEYWIVNYE